MRNKNVLILGLMGVILVMAVSYAAFASQLNINGSANITSDWDISYDTSQTSAWTPNTGISGGDAPTGSISFPNAQTANLNANLVQPGDSVLFTLTIKNNGNINATLGAPSLQGTNCTVNGLTCTTTSGHIRFTVTNPASSTLNASGSTTMTVKAEYVNTTVSSASPESATLKVSINATQAGA